ncbi:hypothetical protein CRE_06998 [Caenorhabditis remanei]|uniref:NTF2-like domain-containing protein n=1 Tax=Caenorhabditis remanei TaxID=31234 RepID=E3NB45_CAERE|nr:hypothetical protein CRE_06998 [Caenorhabditis remanei]
MQMWHPKNGDTDYLSMQVLNVKPNEIVARITMRLQIGIDENATTHEWNMKVATKFNEHADNKWYITRVEVLCHPDIRLMDEHYLVYRDMVGATFMSYIKDANEWYTAVDFGKHFKKGVVELKSCETTVKNVVFDSGFNEFDSGFWDKMDNFYYIENISFACPAWMKEETPWISRLFKPGTYDFVRHGK